MAMYLPEGTDRYRFIYLSSTRPSPHLISLSTLQEEKKVTRSPTLHCHGRPSPIQAYQGFLAFCNHPCVSLRLLQSMRLLLVCIRCTCHRRNPVQWLAPRVQRRFVSFPGLSLARNNMAEDTSCPGSTWAFFSSPTSRPQIQGNDRPVARCSSPKR